MTQEQIAEANQLIDLIEYAVKDLSWFSVDHDDIFNFETSQMEELIKMARKNMPKETEEEYYGPSPMDEIRASENL